MVELLVGGGHQKVPGPKLGSPGIPGDDKPNPLESKSNAHPGSPIISTMETHLRQTTSSEGVPRRVVMTVALGMPVERCRQWRSDARARGPRHGWLVHRAQHWLVNFGKECRGLTFEFNTFSTSTHSGLSSVCSGRRDNRTNRANKLSMASLQINLGVAPPLHLGDLRARCCDG